MGLLLVLPHHFPYFSIHFPQPLAQLPLLRLSVRHHLFLAVAFLTFALALAQLTLHVAELAPCLACGFQEGPGENAADVGIFTALNGRRMIMRCILVDIICMYVSNVI